LLEDYAILPHIVAFINWKVAVMEAPLMMQLDQTTHRGDGEFADGWSQRATGRSPIYMLRLAWKSNYWETNGLNGRAHTFKDRRRSGARMVCWMRF